MTGTSAQISGQTKEYCVNRLIISSIHRRGQIGQAWHCAKIISELLTLEQTHSGLLCRPHMVLVCPALASPVCFKVHLPKLLFLCSLADRVYVIKTNIYFNGFLFRLDVIFLNLRLGPVTSVTVRWQKKEGKLKADF